MGLLTDYKKGFLLRLALFTALFFFWGFVTVLNFVLSDHLQNVFGLTYAVGSLINITFFSSYLIISGLAGKFMSRLGYKNGILFGWVLLCLGCFLISLSIVQRQYYYFLAALFIQAAGITAMQVGANLYVVLMSDKRTAAARLNLVQAFNSLGTFLAPFLAVLILKQYTHLPDDIRKSLSLDELIAMDAAYVHYPYLYMGILMSVFAVLMWFFKIPDIPTQHLEPLNKIVQGRRRVHVMHFRQLRLGAFAIFAYVGAEVAFAKYIVSFTDNDIQYYWGAAMVGRFIGAYLLLKISPRDMVAWCAGIAGGLAILSIATTGDFSMYCIVAIGLFNSILFPTIFSLGVNGLGKFSMNGSSVLIMFIVGGAVIPFNVLNYSYISYKVAFVIPILCYVYIMVYGKSLSRFDVKE